MNLFINIYTDKSEERNNELVKCFELNKLNNPSFKIYELQGRPTFKDIFNIINSVTLPNDINIIINSDIYLPEGFNVNLSANDCYALSRYDIQPDGSAIHYNNSGSQDTWIFRGAIRMVEGANFTQGVAGCLAGNTKIKYLRGNRVGGREISLAEFYKKFNGIKSMRPFRDIGLETFCQSLNTETGQVIYNKVLSVIESGVKETIRVLFNDDTDLILTPDHLILTEHNNYKEAQYLVEGERVVAVGSMKPVASGKKRKYSKRAVIYINYHPFAENKTIKGHKYKRVRRHRLAYEAKMNNLELSEFVAILVADETRAKSLKFLDPKIEVHHEDENTLNDSPDNLKALSKEDHARLHSKEENFNKEYLSFKTVTGIEKCEMIMTYDITMEQPHNNFSANGVIVHNCDNKIAYLLQQAGYRVTNPSLSIKTYHLHLSGIRYYDKPVRPGKPIYRLPRPYLTIKPTELI